MSVLACNVNGCQRIMCDHYSPNFGYICGQHFKELLESGGDMTIAEFFISPTQKDHNAWYTEVIEEFTSERV